MSTVRNQILREIKTRLEAATLGGRAVGLAVFTDQLVQEEVAATISNTASTPKHVVEICVGEDEGPGTRGEASDEAIGIDRIAFIVLLVIHMAELPDPSQTSSSWTELAGEIHNDIYKLYTTVSGTPDQNAESWGDLAIETRRMSGGNLFISDIGTRATTHLFEVVYRHTYGDGSVAR